MDEQWQWSYEPNDWHALQNEIEMTVKYTKKNLRHSYRWLKFRSESSAWEEDCVCGYSKVYAFVVSLCSYTSALAHCSDVFFYCLKQTDRFVNYILPFKKHELKTWLDNNWSKLYQDVTLQSNNKKKNAIQLYLYNDLLDIDINLKYSILCGYWNTLHKRLHNLV